MQNTDGKRPTLQKLLLQTKHDYPNPWLWMFVNILAGWFWFDVLILTSELKGYSSIADYQAIFFIAGVIWFSVSIIVLALGFEERRK